MHCFKHYEVFYRVKLFHSPSVVAEIVWMSFAHHHHVLITKQISNVFADEQRRRPTVLSRLRERERERVRLAKP